MALTKQQKEEILKELVEQLKAAKSVVFAANKGLSVKDMDTLRAKMRENGVRFQVAKKTLLKLAAKDMGIAEIPDESLEGPIGIAFGMEDEIAPAKLIHDFGKKSGNIELRGAIFDGKLMTVAETKQLALIPGKDELIGKFVFLLKAPIQGFHGVLSNTMGGFVRVLNAIKEKQEQAA